MSYLTVILLSMMPVSELRGGLIYAHTVGLNPFIAYFIAVLANIIIVPIVFFFLEYLHDHFMKLRIYQRTFDGFLERTRHKTHKKVEKWGYLGLTLFVAVPLPVTGAYTGTLAAWFFEMDKIKATLAIGLGLLIAGLIMTVGMMVFGFTFWR